jgi:ADP-dependent NAD(P)H-hydrate dehydratase / NAD(P)H-hydrate epimerase
MFAAESGPPILTAAQMRRAEAAVIAAGTPALDLMATAAAGFVAALSPNATGLAPTASTAAPPTSAPAPPASHRTRNISILCGPGNNGGDGYAIARLLGDAGWDVTVAADAPPATEPAATMARRWTGPVVPLIAASRAPLIIDALFGIGLTRPLSDSVQAALDRLRGCGEVVAVDIASGVDSDTGRALGRPLAAARTISFAAAKPGHVLNEGAELTGELQVVDIGVTAAADCHFTARPRLLPLPRGTHKYARGSVLVVEGNHGGAAALAGLAALRMGAGLVTLAGAGTALPALALMRQTDDDALKLLDDKRLKAVVIGPGLIDDPRARSWLARLRAGTCPLVIDAGALRLLGSEPIGPPAVLTPHIAEFASVFGPPGQDLIAAVRVAACACQSVVLLKGATTIIAAPDGRAAINTHASPWLATAGSGDVLAGMIGSCLAQGLPAFEAAQVAVWLHGEVGRRLGPGGIADDLLALMPNVLGSL